MDTKFFKILHKNFSITEHPDFPLHHGPWFNRGSSMKGFEPGRKFATYGIDIRGYERGVCVRTKNISLHYCGQIMPIAAYESDGVNKEWAQCWIFMRRPITKSSPQNLSKELVPFYDGVHSYGKTRVDWPSSTSTTEVYPPENALCSLCYIQDKAAAMYNKFRINVGNQYKFDLEEINLATNTGFHVYYICKVDLIMSSSKPYTIACRLGKLDEVQTGRLTGVGAKHSYAFDDFIGTFLYLNEIDSENNENVIKIEKVRQETTGEDLDALYVQPTQAQSISFGFSNNFYEYGSKERHNSLIALPTINELVTEDFKVEKIDIEDALLFLHNYSDKTIAISYAFNYTLPRGFKLKKSILDERFKSYDVVDGILNSAKTEYTINTYEKQFQMVLKNVVYKE